LKIDPGKLTHPKTDLKNIDYNNNVRKSKIKMTLDYLKYRYFRMMNSQIKTISLVTR